MSEHLSHRRRRQVLDRPSVIERFIRVNLYFIQAQLGAAPMAAIGAVGFHRPAQPAGSSDRRDGEIKLPISGSTQGEQNNNIQTTNRPAASCDSRSKSWFSKIIKQCRRKKHTERDDEISLINGTSTATDDEQTNNETTEDERAHEAIEDSSEWSRWSWLWKMSFYILIAFTVVGFPLLIVYLYHSYECAHHKHRAHYHCINGTSPHGIPQKYALIMELNFVLLQLSCRAIFIAFCFRQTGWKGFKNIFLEKVFDDREYTFPLVGYYIASAARFVFLLLDEDHMGPHKQSAKAVISLYIIDDLGILIVICTLNYVKIKDLSENKKVQNGFTLVLFSFWLQFFAYWFISGIQIIAFGIVSPKGLMKNLYNLLTLWGQFVYLRRIRDCLWHKLNGDEEPAIGVKSSDEKKSASQKPIRKVRWPIKTKWKHRTLYINGRRKMQSRGIQQKRVTPNGSKKSKTETQNEQRKSKTNNQ